MRPLDVALASLSNATRASNTSLIPAFNISLKSMIQPTKSILDKIGQDQVASHGALSFLLDLGSGVTGIKTVVDSQGYVMAYSSKVTREDSEVCLTDACLTNEMNGINTGESLYTSLAPVPEGLPAREALFLVFLIFPLLVGVCAHFAVLAPCVCTTSRYQKCPPCCFMLCTFCCAPCMLLFGALFSVFIFLLSDVCVSIEPAAVSLVSSNSEGVCALVGGQYSASTSLCSLEAAVPGLEGGNLSLQLDVPGIARGAFGAAPAVAGTDPISDLVSSLGPAAGDMFGNVSASLINSSLATFNVQPPLRRALLKGTGEVSTAIRSSFASLASVFNSDSLHAVINSLLSPICFEHNSLIAAAILMLAPWPLIGLVLVTCGCCCAIGGYKRIPSKPWGPLWEADVASVGAVDLDSDAPAGSKPGRDAVQTMPRGARVQGASAERSSTDDDADEFAFSSPVGSAKPGKVKPSPP